MATKATKPLRRVRATRKTTRRFEPKPMLYADATALRKEAARRGGYRPDTVAVIANATLQLNLVTPYVSPSPAGELLANALKRSIRARCAFNGTKASHQAMAEAERELCITAAQLIKQPIHNVRDLLLLGECARQATAESRSELVRILLDAMDALSRAPLVEAA